MTPGRAKPCPCTSGRAYGECCGPLHTGGEAPTPEALVRARFAAFALRDAEYLWRTLHPDHEDRSGPKAPFVTAIRGTRLRFMRLVILATGPGEVTFRAEVFDRGTDVSFTERSAFGEAEGGWRYTGVVAE